MWQLYSNILYITSPSPFIQFKLLYKTKRIKILRFSICHAWNKYSYFLYFFVSRCMRYSKSSMKRIQSRALDSTTTSHKNCICHVSWLTAVSEQMNSNSILFRLKQYRLLFSWCHKMHAKWLQNKVKCTQKPLEHAAVCMRSQQSNIYSQIGFLPFKCMHAYTHTLVFALWWAVVWHCCAKMENRVVCVYVFVYVCVVISTPAINLGTD